MRAIDIPQIEKLSTSEKILLVEDLWDQISESESEISVPESHKLSWMPALRISTIILALFFRLKNCRKESTRENEI